MTSAIETQGLEKLYARLWGQHTLALAGVSLQVRSGQIFGLLGRNGAGKTTLVKILLGLAHPTSGNARVLGASPGNASMRRRVGYLPEQMHLPDYFKAESFLHYMGALGGVSAAERNRKIPVLLELVGLTGVKKLVREYSKGMQQRLGLAQALINDPDLLFLDEPTEGLDPIGRKQVRDLLLDLRAAGKTIFLNSHLLSEIELICDEVAILDRGLVVRHGAPSEFAHATGEYRIRVAEVTDAVRHAAANVISDAQWDDASVRVHPHDRAELNALIDALRAVPVEIEAVEPIRASFEASFIEAVAGGKA